MTIEEMINRCQVEIPHGQPIRKCPHLARIQSCPIDLREGIRKLSDLYDGLSRCCNALRASSTIPLRNAFSASGSR